MRQTTSRLEVTKSRNQGNVDDGNVSDPEIESWEEEEHVAITHEMRFLKSVLGSSSKPRPKIPIYQGNIMSKGIPFQLLCPTRYLRYKVNIWLFRVEILCSRLQQLSMQLSLKITIPK